MNRNLKIALWVSCLALTGLLASCGTQNVGTPIQPELNASSVMPLPADANGTLPIQTAPGDGGRSVSYTPGLPLNILAGVTNPNVEGYGWKGGSVVDGLTAPYVTLTTGAPGIVPTPIAWLAYDFRELVIGRLQTIKLTGNGQGLYAWMYNWNAGTWVFTGVYNLGMGPANIVVPADMATNGDTFLLLAELKPGKTTITKLETNVF